MPRTPPTGLTHTASSVLPYRRRRRPPYGARLAAVLARPETWPEWSGTSSDRAHLTLWVLAGPDAWRIAGVWLATRALYVVAPPGEDPAGYDWRVVAGHPPVLVHPCGDLTQAEFAALVGALVRDGAERVLVLFGGDPSRPVRLYRVPGVSHA